MHDLHKPFQVHKTHC